MKKQNLIVISMLLLVVLGVSAVQAAECKGTLSGPTKQLIVGETFTITFFNAEPTSTGDNLTLNLPTGLTTTSTNPVNSVNSFTAYSWTVNSTIAGQYNVNISFAMVNCTKSFGPTNVLNKIADPSLGISVDAVANMIKGKQQNANFAIDNTGGNAYNLSGIVATKAGDTILPNTFTKDVLGNHSSNNTQNYTVTITPNACGVGNGLLVHLINYQNAYGDFQVPFTGLSLDFNTTGSDVAITSFTSSPNPVVESAKTNVSITVMNIGTIIAENIFAKIYNGSNLITTLSLGNVAVGGSSTATYEYIAALTGGTHILTAVVDGDTECLASNNNGNTSLQVTAGTCKDGVQNQGEESLDCGGPCTACSTLTTTSSSSSGGGGGGGGGGHGNIYFLTLTATNPKKTMSLETADTVRFAYDGKTYSISFKQFKSDSAKFSLAREFSTKSYEVKANVTQKLDLDLDGVDDLSVTPTKMKYWKSDVMFGLLGVAKYSIPTYVLPTVTKNKTSDYKSASSKTPLKTGETGTVKKKVESITQGVLDFVESFDVKKSTPAWAGVGVSLLVIVVGMVGYYFVARKYD